MPREHKAKVIPCIKGPEKNSRFEEHSETKPAAVSLYHYLPSQRQERQTSVKVAITRGGGDTGFQGSGSMATGNGDSSGSDNSDNPQSGSDNSDNPQSGSDNSGNPQSGSDNSDTLNREVKLNSYQSQLPARMG